MESRITLDSDENFEVQQSTYKSSQKTPPLELVGISFKRFPRPLEGFFVARNPGSFTPPLFVRGAELIARFGRIGEKRNSGVNSYVITHGQFKPSITLQ